MVDRRATRKTYQEYRECFEQVEDVFDQCMLMNLLRSGDGSENSWFSEFTPGIFRAGFFVHEVII
jgi:hypothetical protein